MKMRAFRAPDDDWDAAMKRAAEDGNTLASVLRAFLRRYGKRED